MSTVSRSAAVPGRRIAGVSREWGRAARAGPRLLEALARRFTDDGVALRFEVREIEGFGRRLERSVDRLVVGLVTAALIIGSSILMSVEKSGVSTLAWVLGFAGIVIAFSTSVWIIRSIRRSREPDRPS